jgi:hypothetical protein
VYELAFATALLTDLRVFDRSSRHDAANFSPPTRLFPMVNVRDIESGKVRVARALFGAD